MKYRTKRGRPTSHHAKKDLGTPELIAKRKEAFLVGEPLDACLQREMISAEEHWAGIHLRWLYGTIFGIPNVRASNPASPKGRCLERDNEAWMAKREQEYAKAHKLLHELKALPLVSDICVFSRYPSFLIGNKKCWFQMIDLDGYHVFREGLQGLYRLFSGSSP